MKPWTWSSNSSRSSSARRQKSASTRRRWRLCWRHSSSKDWVGWMLRIECSKILMRCLCQKLMRGGSKRRWHQSRPQQPPPSQVQKNHRQQDHPSQLQQPLLSQSKIQAPKLNTVRKAYHRRKHQQSLPRTQSLKSSSNLGNLPSLKWRPLMIKSKSLWKSKLNHNLQLRSLQLLSRLCLLRPRNNAKQRRKPKLSPDKPSLRP